MEEMNLEMEELEQFEEGDERQNRTFILLVAVMGGLLLIGIVAFCAWALIVGRGMLGGQAVIPPTDTPVETATALGATAMAEATMSAAMAAEVTPTPSPSPTPTATSRPARSPTPRLQTPRPGTPVGAAQVTPTIGPRQVQTPTAPTATRTPATSSAPATTGLGAFTAVIIATGLLVLLIVARRLRTAH